MLICTHNKSFFSIIFLFCLLIPNTETYAQFRKNDLYSNDSLFTIPLYETPRLNNDSLVRIYDKYSKQGIENAKRYKWEETARKTIEVFESVME